MHKRLIVLGSYSLTIRDISVAGIRNNQKQNQLSSSQDATPRGFPIPPTVQILICQPSVRRANPSRRLEHSTFPLFKRLRLLPRNHKIPGASLTIYVTRTYLRILIRLTSTNILSAVAFTQPDYVDIPTCSMAPEMMYLSPQTLPL